MLLLPAVEPVVCQVYSKVALLAVVATGFVRVTLRLVTGPLMAKLTLEMS